MAIKPVKLADYEVRSDIFYLLGYFSKSYKYNKVHSNIFYLQGKETERRSNIMERGPSVVSIIQWKKLRLC